MKNVFVTGWLWAIALAAGGTLVLLLNGCSSTAQARATSNSEEEMDLAAVHPAKEKGGAQLWAERCTQCHYARDPGTFSPQQWEVIMLHMRVRANLTAAEHQSILEFFKSAN